MSEFRNYISWGRLLAYLYLLEYIGSFSRERTFFCVAVNLGQGNERTIPNSRGVRHGVPVSGLIQQRSDGPKTADNVRRQQCPVSQPEKKNKK